VATFFSTFAGIFSFSFLVALTGAMSPGPLLTYTIVQSARSRHRGYLMGAWVITGHALLEMLLVVLLLLGFSLVLQKPAVVRTIGIAGGLILVGFGVAIARDVFLGRISTDFLGTAGESGRTQAMKNPVLGGVLVSMSNPYWWVWWATIGVAFMIQFGITIRSGTKLLAFFLGHEAGDLLWYLVVSFLSFFGLRRLNQKVYYGVLLCCALFMVVFGAWLCASAILRPRI